MRVTLLVLIIVFVTQDAYCNRKVIIDYFDKDNIKDTLIIVAEEGNHNMGVDLHFAFSSNKRKLDISFMTDFNTFIDIAPVPDEMVNIKIYTSVIKEMFTDAKIKDADCSIDWYEYVCSHSASPTHKYVYSEDHFLPVFHKGLPELQTPHCQIVAADSLRCLLDKFNYAPGDKEKDTGLVAKMNFRKYIVINFLQNHGSFERIPNIRSINGEQYYKTKHGIFVTKDSSYAWLFINDYLLFGSTDLLRRRSIQDIEVYGDNLCVHVYGQPGERFYFVLNLKYNKIYRLKNMDEDYLEDSIMYSRAMYLIENHLR